MEKIIPALEDDLDKIKNTLELEKRELEKGLLSNIEDEKDKENNKEN